MKSRLTHLLCTVLFSAISLCSMAGEALVENESFDLKNVKSLTLKINHAEIELVQGKDRELKVTLSQKLKRGDADICLHKISHSLKADRLEVYTEARKSSNFSSCDVQRSVHIQLDQESIQKLNIQHSHGAFSGDALTAKEISLSISHSKATLEELASTTAELEFDHTDTNIKTIASNKLEINGAHGAIHINKLSSEYLLLKRSHGDVEINQSEVDQFTAQQSHGDLMLKAHQGTKLDLHNAHGSITVSEGKAETVELENSHSPITYSGNSTTLRFSNAHGSTKIEQHNATFKSIEGKATHGSIELTLPKNSVCDLEGDSPKKVSAEMFRKDDGCDEGKSNGLVKVQTTHGKATINAL